MFVPSSLLTALSLAFGLASCLSRTEPPPGAIVVAKSGGQFDTIQAAINSLPVNTTAPQKLFIRAGNYTEQVYIPTRQAVLTIYGETRDTSSYESNTVWITDNIPKAAVTANDLTATLRNWSPNSKVYNINIANLAGPSGAQSLALSAQATNQGYYGVSLQGWQDTLLANVGLQFYAHSEVIGGTDFIFTQHGEVYLTHTDIRLRPQSIGYVTASGRNSSTDPGIIVIDKSDIRAVAGANVTDGSYYLGRPWGFYARSVVERTYLSAAINSAGWHIWNVGDERIANTTFEEYHNYGPGAYGVRANFSSELTAPVTIAEVFGANYTSWVDMAYV